MTKNSNCRKHGKQIKGTESTDTFQSLAVPGNEQGRQNTNPEAGWKKVEGGKALPMGRQDNEGDITLQLSIHSLPPNT